MKGRVALVTGASSGVGLEAAKGLANLGARVLLVARDAARGEAALRAVAQQGDAELFLADLASQAQVRRLAAAVERAHPALHVLVNNAGAIHAARSLTEDGVERTLAVNHLAPFLLTHLLLPALRRAAPSRVVTVASMAHRFAPPGYDFRGEGRYLPWVAYCASKRANIQFTRELARREAEAGSGVRAFALHPGTVRTRFGEGLAAPSRLGWLLAQPFLRSPARAADTVVWLAAGGAQGTGGYYKDRKLRTPSRAARDPAAAHALWERSARATGLA